MGQIVQEYAVPRWLHTQIEVPAGSEVRIDSDAFANNTWHRMRLVALTFGNNGPTTFAAAGSPPIADSHQAWASELLVDIGKSQCSDINLVSGSLTSLCANPRRQRQMVGAVNMGRTYRFPTPYLLPRDEGLSVRVEYIRDPYLDIVKNGVNGPDFTDEITFIAKGFYEDGYPGMLAGRADPFDFTPKEGSHLLQGTSVEMISADLFNGGKRPLYLTELCFKEMDLITSEVSGEFPTTYRWLYGSGMTFAWLVNPTNPTATKWMVSSQCIPTGLLTPQCRNYDGGSDGPLAYFFPPKTYLDPKQAISIRLGNTLNNAVPLRVCLIGELEVR
jgi:hypothetical protein